MKARVLPIVLVAAVLVLLVARLIRPTPQTAPSNPPTNTVAEASSPTPSPQPNPESSRTASPRQSAVQNFPGVPGNLATELPPGSNLQGQLEELARQRGVPLTLLTQQLTAELSNAFSQALNGPVDFYGKAVDENGATVGGATATFRCLMFPESQFTTNAIADPNGLFTLRGIQGQGLSVTVTKQGYEEVPGTNEHHFAYYGVAKGFQPDPYNPVIFMLRQKPPQ
jgi:hypothetical protein